MDEVNEHVWPVGTLVEAVVNVTHASTLLPGMPAGTVCRVVNTYSAFARSRMIVRWGSAVFSVDRACFVRFVSTTDAEAAWRQEGFGSE